jgi:hypothetical protein
MALLGVNPDCSLHVFSICRSPICTCLASDGIPLRNNYNYIDGREGSSDILGSAMLAGIADQKNFAVLGRVHKFL